LLACFLWAVEMMLRNTDLAVTRVYAVEVSGWDSKEHFFVERCELEWDEESSKQVALTRALGKSTRLLVRLLEEAESDRSLPVVYEAEFVGKTKSGRQQFRLNAVIPS
jgi:hypothetical protein